MYFCDTIDCNQLCCNRLIFDFAYIYGIISLSLPASQTFVCIVYSSLAAIHTYMLNVYKRLSLNKGIKLNKISIALYIMYILTVLRYSYKQQTSLIWTMSSVFRKVDLGKYLALRIRLKIWHTIRTLPLISEQSEVKNPTAYSYSLLMYIKDHKYCHKT
jgi:hypothetical protein